ncbi:Retrovirus-related Pol polyprotein from transposon opus [Araneus ventricosus]|uniref:Retrovirus-related Pol polyprotein from transposon opus n=1 Tax=Araneus ventricosus TaxID=182803 RepID=A0A4Y2IKA6_ARAVE|nr:Retrovirus-related Pol polyprotein from transposon opus [Araneus ventricosus]
MPDGPEITKPELARVAFRAPPFWETDPDLWFLQLESQFKLSSISTDETKFHSVVAALDSKVLSYVSDIVRKLKGSSVSAVTDGGHYHSRLFLYGGSTGFRFLNDSGAAASCVPRRLTKHRVAQDTTLPAANGSAIKCYGTKQINLDLGLRRKFSWCFLISDVSHPIIGSDFLERFELLIDIKNRRLIDSRTFLSTKGVKASGKTLRLTLISNKSPFHTILSKFREIFSPMSADVDTPQNVERCIETKGPPVFSKARRQNPEKLKFLKQEFQTLMEQGILRPSQSAFVSPIHFVKKPNGDWRICREFRRLNAITIPDRYPLPHIQDFSNNLAGKTIFSKIDLVKAYHQIPVKTSDIHKTAVITPISLFEYSKMSFGLRNAAQTFQRFIDQVLRGLDCFAYLDDILVASEDLAKHKVDLEKVFNRLKDYHLKINLEKCIFGQETIQFLGFQVSPGGVSPLPDRVRALTEYPLPKSVAELRRFLAMINFYHRFLKPSERFAILMF